MGLNLCTNHWGQEIYQNCKNDGPTLTFDFFTAKSDLLPMHLYGPYTFIVEKNVENSYFGHYLYNPVESKLDDEISLCICMVTILLYGKNVENFKRLLL